MTAATDVPATRHPRRLPLSIACVWSFAFWAMTMLVALLLSMLVSWPRPLGLVAIGAAIVGPLLLLGGSMFGARTLNRLMRGSATLGAVLVTVLAAFALVFLGLGRPPTVRERVVLVLSMGASGLAILAYPTLHDRSAALVTRLLRGARGPVDDPLRVFGSRLRRDIPLDELLLQVAESLRRTFDLGAAEIWTFSGSTLERTAADPHRGAARLPLAQAEESVVANAGISGGAWMKIWLPTLVEGKEDYIIRAAPITRGGELFGLIVLERRPGDEPFDDEVDRTLAELARQVALALHNARLDSALQASLEELRERAQELQASRARLVVAQDAERRRIERDIHDGAQQHLVGLAVKLRLARELAGEDVEKAAELLDQLKDDLRDALQELRALAHGIYPPLLAERGLIHALNATAERAPVPTELQETELRRYPPEIEAAVYFCCREALQNVGKYAGEGATAAIKLWEEEGALLFEVADTGAGFDTKQRALGVGFVNMQDRVGALGGTLTIDSAPGEGTRVGARIPVGVGEPFPK